MVESHVGVGIERELQARQKDESTGVLCDVRALIAGDGKDSWASQVRDASVPAYFRGTDWITRFELDACVLHPGPPPSVHNFTFNKKNVEAFTSQFTVPGQVRRVCAHPFCRSDAFTDCLVVLDALCSCSSPISACVQVYDHYANVRDLLRADPRLGNYRRLGVVGDDFRTWRPADTYPINHDARPHFGPLFWLLSWPLLWKLTHLSKHFLVNAVHEA